MRRIQDSNKHIIKEGEGYVDASIYEIKRLLQNSSIFRDVSYLNTVPKQIYAYHDDNEMPIIITVEHG